MINEQEKIEKLKIEFEKLELEKGKILLILDYVNNRMDTECDEKAVIACSGPYRVHLEKENNYFYCTCGKSKSQPFCDGNHKDTNFKPLKFSIKHDVKWSLLCGCKQNDVTSGPFCDGNHVKIEW